jgi:hypothetical protein
MDNTIDLLFIDDNEDIFNSMIRSARKQNINLICKPHLIPDGLHELTENRKIQGVILDGKGKIKQNQEVESFGFVHESLEQIALLEKSQDRLIPKCVYTGLYGDIKPMFEGRNIEIFDKALGLIEEEKMFKFLISQIENTLDFKIRKDNQSVFAALHKDPNLSTRDKNLFLLLKKTVTGTNDDRESNTARKLLERIFKQINKQNKSLLPDNLFLNGEPSLGWCVHFLKGNEIKDGDNIIQKGNYIDRKKQPRVPFYIANSIQFIKDNTSGDSHDFPDFQFPKYTFASIVFALCQIIVWYSEHVYKD